MGVALLVSILISSYISHRPLAYYLHLVMEFLLSLHFVTLFLKMLTVRAGFGLRADGRPGFLHSPEPGTKGAATRPEKNA